MSHSQGDLTLNHGNDHSLRRSFDAGSYHPNFRSIPPDKFLAKAHLIQATKIPSQLNPCGEWGKVVLFNS